MCFSAGIRGHEYAKYPQGNVSRKHGVDPVKHEWLLSLLFRACVCVSAVENEARNNGTAVFISEVRTKKKKKEKKTSYLLEVSHHKHLR